MRNLGFRKFGITFSFMFLLASCAETPLVMESLSDPQYVRPLENVLIVANGDLFPGATKQILFLPSVDVVRRVLAQHGVASTAIELPKNDLNPGAQIGVAARDTKATHVLHFAVTQVSSRGPKVAEGDPRNQFRLVSDYSYTLVMTDLLTRKNVWKADVRGGSGSTEETLRQFEQELRDNLYRGRLLKPRSVPAK